MKLIISFFCIISSFLFASCTKSIDNADVAGTIPNDDLYVVDVDSMKSRGILYLSEVFTKVRTVILETNNDVLIGNISSVQIYNDTIFVLDINKARGLFMFDKDGRFLKRIGNVGKGTGEYINPNDFTIDKQNKHIYILDTRAQKILKYDLNSGLFLGSTILADDKYRSFNIQVVKGVMYADAFYYSDIASACLLQEIDMTSGDRTRSLLKSSEYNKSINDMYFSGKGVFFDRNQESPKFIKNFMDTVIALDYLNVKPYLTLKSKDMLTQTDLEKMQGSIDDKIQALFSMPKIYDINTFVSTKHLIYFECMQQNRKKCFFYNIQTGQSILGSGVADDLVNKKEYAHLGVLPTICCSDRETMYAYISPNEMPRFIDFSRSNLAQSVDKREKLQNLELGSNPVIFVYEK